MAKKFKRPTPVVRFERGKLTPISAWEAELLDGFADGHEFDLVSRSKRSVKHSAKYWVILRRIVDATAAFTTPAYMHDWVKIRLGYVKPVLGPHGEIAGVTIDSTSFDNMDQDAFNEFYRKFGELVAREMQIDIDRT